MNKWVPVVALVTACWSLNALGATVVSCPGGPAADADSRQFFVTPNSDGAGKPVCYLWGDGNGAAGNASDAVLAADSTYLFLDKANGNGTADTSGLLDGALIVSGQGTASSAPAPYGSVSGTFYVNAAMLAGFGQFIIAFTTGQPPAITPDFAAYKFFNITECTQANPCDWSTIPSQAGGLSHATLYGVVPIPAAAWLLGSGLLGLFAVGRRRKLNVAAA